MDSQANQNTGKLELFHHVSRGDVHRLEKSVESQGPEAVGVVSIIKTILDLWQKNDAYRCTILAPEGGEDKGVCAIIMGEYERKQLVLYAPEDETTHFLKCVEDTNLIAWESVDVVSRLIKRLRDRVDRMLEAKGYELYSGDLHRIMTMPPDKAMALEESKLPNNVFFRDLTENDAPTLAEYFDFKGKDSLPSVRDGLKYNGGVGAVDKDGELIGWAIWSRWGVIGQLFVSPSHRRLGIGRILTIRLAKKIAQKGRIVIAYVQHDNEASSKLFQSLGFQWEYLDCNRKINHDK